MTRAHWPARSTPAVQERLSPIIASREAATCTVVELDILYSTRSRNESARVHARRALAYRRIDVTETIFSRAIDVQELLAGCGRHRIRISDPIIAAAAEAARMTVLHYDADFDTVAAVTGQDAERVVARGAL